ncbi:MAG TPA: class I SAM-dependent methyltransferase [Phaeodactylibacter sp.]|nr:class I SAM-dependent methyltransferase [Phaeodactylibacter sp.]
MKEFWNSRYASSKFAYGTTPNQFFKEILEQQKLQGKILLPAEGEGRNAVFAAKQGLSVFAFDISSEGKNKALALAKSENVQIKYEVGQLHELNFEENSFDAAALIFAHFPSHLKSDLHKKISNLIKPNGILILEGFSKKHLKLRTQNPNAGGPGKLEMLFSEEEIKKDFSDFEIIKLQEMEVNLKEGAFHNGKSSVIRFVGKKKFITR